MKQIELKTINWTSISINWKEIPIICFIKENNRIIYTKTDWSKHELKTTQQDFITINWINREKRKKELYYNRGMQHLLQAIKKKRTKENAI